MTAPGHRRGPRAARGERAQEGPQVAQSTSRLSGASGAHLEQPQGVSGNSGKFKQTRCSLGREKPVKGMRFEGD